MTILTTKIVLLPETRDIEQEKINFALALLSSIQDRAYREIHENGLENDEFVIFCIKVNSPWKFLAEKLFPNLDYREIEEKGLDPVAIGIKPLHYCNELFGIIPEIEKFLFKKPLRGRVQAVLLCVDGPLIIEVKPIKRSG